jgi:RHS repeat-associated protein
MTHLALAPASCANLILKCSLAGLLLIFLFSGRGVAQSTTAVDGYTPLGLSPGAPAGSYSLSGFEYVNLFNGNLNFALPLLGVGGRGGAGYQITRPIERKWVVEQFYDEFGQFYSYFPSEPVQLWANPDYGAGTLTARYAHWGARNCPRPDGTVQKAYDRTLTRLTFTAPGGTQYELRDQQTNGQYYTVPSCPASGSSYNRGNVFITSDGTSATFISDTDITEGLIADDPYWYADPYDISGYLLLRDGTRYRLEHGMVSWIRDRNGNKVAWSNGIIDPLNRKVTITYQSQSAPYDDIKYEGFGGADRTIRVTYTPLASALRLGYAPQTPKQLFPELDGSSTTDYDPQVIRSITLLPDGRSYTFSYNSYGELARVVLPTGGAIEYDYAAGLTNGNASGTINFGLTYGGGAMDWQIYRRVIERRTYANGTTLESKTTFSRPESVVGSTLGYVVVDQMNAAGTLLARQKHYFHGSAADSLDNTGIFASLAYPGWKEGREWKTEMLDDDGATVLKRVEHTWQQPVAGSTWPLTQPETSDVAKPNNPQITQTVTTLVDTNQVTKQTFTYDQYNNQTNVYEYNYGAGVVGTLVRRTSSTYVTTNVVGGVTYNYQTDPSIHLRSLPKQTSVYDAAGVEQARTTFEYDNYTATTNHAALVARTGISGLDSSFTTSYGKRGNTTAVTRYLLTNGAMTSSISTYQQYDAAGNVVKTIDGLGNQTTFSFNDCFGSPNAEAHLNASPIELSTQYSYAFPTLVTNASGHTTYTQYDYYTGKAVDVEDANGVTSSVYYNDDLDRPTQVINAADDLALRSQTTYNYDDTYHIVTTTSDLSDFGDNRLKSQTLYDGLGRTTETRQYETATTYITTKQAYDALGRVSKVSNPYRSGQTILWTTSAYDALGRVISVTTPDSAIVSTVYSGNTVTVTDQAGKDRQSTTDALGRLTQVIEDPGTGGLNYTTTYAYDVLGNLKTVTQGSQTRSFTYDSLSRLKSTVNPESGTINYVYDNNDNLTQKTDARSISITISYDVLNRPTLKNYSDTTPDVAYFYDAQTLPTGAPSFVRGAATGKLVAVTTGGTSVGSYYGYDGLGQTLRRIQQTDSVNYLVEAAYNKAGAMTGETYPQVPGHSGRRTVSYSFDMAGRLSSLTTAATTYAAAASLTGISYAPHGGLASETLGNNLVHALIYNNRLQPTQFKLGTTAAPTSVLNLSYNYGTTANNGNVLDVTNTIGTWTTKQIHTYDALNRLDATQETNGSTTIYWTEDEAYDRYGNRWEVNAGIASLTFNAQNNRITSAGYVYDAGGNLTNDTVHTYGYDAENRIRTVDGVMNTYQYDGEGRRVRKYFPLGEQVRFVYGISGQLIAEFETTSGAVKKEYIYGGSGLLATIEPVTGTRYTTADHLGSPRILTSSAGAVVSRHDYRSFGEELPAGTGGRTTAQGYSAVDNIRQKFTSHERDNEIGLDFMQARYYSSTQGRFTSPDSIEGNALNPQTMNLYAYVHNNPLKFIDPSGHSAVPSMWRPQSSADFERLSKQLMYDSLGIEQPSPKIDKMEFSSGTQGDNVVQVESAYLDPFEIKGRISLNEVTFQVTNIDQARTIFGEGSEDPLTITLYLTLPKNTTEVAPSKIKTIPRLERDNKGVQRAVFEEVIEGSKVSLTNVENSNLRLSRRIEGLVSFPEVNYSDRGAVAKFSLYPRKGYNVNDSNSVNVLIKGWAKTKVINTTIRVTIIPPGR